LSSTLFGISRRPSTDSATLTERRQDSTAECATPALPWVRLSAACFAEAVHSATKMVTNTMANMKVSARAAVACLHSVAQPSLQACWELLAPMAPEAIRVVRQQRKSGWVLKVRVSLGKASSLFLWAALLSAFLLIPLSELFLLLQFPNKFSYSPPPTPHSAPRGFTPTPVGWLLSFGRGPESTNEAALLCVGVTLLLSCAWSLNRIEMGAFWYRMVPPYATDTSSLAFNSAIFCRIAVMLVLNVDMLVLPTEANGFRTSQTRFYCQFGRKARLLVPLQNGHDFYLLVLPLLLLLLVIALHFNVLSRVKSMFARIFQEERHAVFRFGRTVIPYHEDKGRELLQDIERAQQSWAHTTITCAWRRKLMLSHPET